MFHDSMIWPFFFIWPFHGLFTLLIVIVVLSLIFRRHHYYYGHPWGWNGRSEALSILEQRYARGEITREEYLRMKQDLAG
jgi:putative membrane protein